MSNAFLSINRKSIEVWIHCFFTWSLFVLCLGLFYPVYAAFPQVFKFVWDEPEQFKYLFTPVIWVGILNYAFGVWVWYIRFQTESHPFERFWLGRQVLSCLGAMLLSFFVSMAYSAAHHSLSVVLYFIFLPLFYLFYLPFCFPVVRASLFRRQLLYMIALPLVAFAFLKMSWILSCGMVLIQFLLTPIFLQDLKIEWEHRAFQARKSPWQFLFAVTLVALGLVGGQAYVLWQNILREVPQLEQDFKRAHQKILFKRPVLRPPIYKQNAFDIYQKYFKYQKNNPSEPQLKLAFKDSFRLKRVFNPETLQLTMDPNVLTPYSQLIKDLHQAGHSEYMHYALGANHKLMRIPYPGNIQDFSLLMLIDALQPCQSRNCLRRIQSVLDTERFLQDIASHGLMTPVMVAFKQERLLISLLSHYLKSVELSSQDWKTLLNEWEILRQSEQMRFQDLLHMELIYAQENLLSLLPDLSANADMEYGSLIDWLGILPYIAPGLNELRQFDHIAGDYVRSEFHQVKPWQKMQQKQNQLLKGNPFLKPILIDLVAVTLRQREHQMIMAGFHQYLALQAYFAEHKNYPQTLTQLRPVYLKQLPQDPFTAEDFVYRKSGKDFMLYSKGLNQRDDGGKGYFGHFIHKGGCTGEEIVFANRPPAHCQFN